MDNRTEFITKGVLILMMIVFWITFIGTALIPAVVAYKYGWRWLLLYPIILLSLILAGYKKKMDK